jgi:hypothetical protein
VDPFKRKRNERFVSNIAYNNGMVKDKIIGSDIFTTEIKKYQDQAKDMLVILVVIMLD